MSDEAQATEVLADGAAARRDEQAGDGGSESDDELIRSGRDAAVTRRALVRAARRRFATDGYRATTVRRIAADAGVNVALINRYFESKEGLFEACMLRTSSELGLEEPSRANDLDDVIERLTAHVVNSPDSDDPIQLLLLLRSSGDENADRIRRKTIERFTQRLAAAAGWSADDPDTAPILLRAQIAIATGLGVLMLRTSTAVEPISSAGSDELAGPLRQVFRDLLVDVPDSSSRSD